MKTFDKHNLFMSIFMAICLIGTFLLGDYYLKRAIILGVIGTVVIVWLEMNK